ncbi:hypothetical protein [Paracoccus sp. (in: a-proteobacteria)]|uniref:hypothetical protein n=1 Tax=Paracoccus sp. TaxID=267 RepID=UPI0028A00CB1|nr:hypothetical protein [Paracoccus sp. (in: a-proteobacteria)]
MNRHPLDGDAIAADRHYERLSEHLTCTICDEYFGLPQDGCVIKSRDYEDLCMACADQVNERDLYQGTDDA